MFWTILFYAIIAVGALLFFGLLYYRIDWARHPEKYKDLEDTDSNKKSGKSTNSTQARKSKRK